MLNSSDEQLIAKYLLGDEKSLEILIKRYLKSIYGFACRYAGNAQDAEDITQEVFIKIWRNLKKFDQQKSFKTWIFSIAKNTSIDWLKKKKAMPFSNFENKKGENLIANTLADSALLPDKIFELSDAARMLNAAVGQLAPKYRAVLLFYYNGCFNFREIAETFGESVNTVKSRHRRALLLLKKLVVEP
ncbi:RNA polymerase sigma factor [Patescibacteria group bacterium]|nr:RNA polymerase sigma factor [Candidatus Falkowbacteria bacterium]MBU3906187.1 RNA polymerase sigma factor [Patescibacteria group bacterium]MCG2698110.1 RNA polymerase sigma factor [Candidatus Parcubacteria bacterium]MBU4015593.1 RNA polymerase sigma factor [Patescibacteria group bacterium]MBU4026345.1 RNA polymerase sigma factor [Patescibacteria group bacterium]